MPIPLRFQLSPPTEELIQKMCRLCDEIEQTIHEQNDPSELLAEWHRHATRECDPIEFTTYWEAISQEDFVREVFNPCPVFVDDLTYAEARAVLEAVVNVELKVAETHYFLNWLETQFPGSNMSDLIYWPDIWFGDRAFFRNSDGKFKPEAELSLDQILGYAMKRSSRELPGIPTGIPLPYPMPK